MDEEHNSATLTVSGLPEYVVWTCLEEKTLFAKQVWEKQAY